MVVPVPVTIKPSSRSEKQQGQFIATGTNIYMVEEKGQKISTLRLNYIAAIVLKWNGSGKRKEEKVVLYADGAGFGLCYI